MKKIVGNAETGEKIKDYLELFCYKLQVKKATKLHFVKYNLQLLNFDNKKKEKIFVNKSYKCTLHPKKHFIERTLLKTFCGRGCECVIGILFHKTIKISSSAFV